MSDELLLHSIDQPACDIPAWRAQALNVAPFLPRVPAVKLTAWEANVAKVSNPNVAPTGTVEAVYQAIYHHGIDGLQLLEAVASDMGMCGLDCLSVFTMPYLEPTRPGATCQCDLALLRITSNRLHDAEK